MVGAGSDTSSSLSAKEKAERDHERSRYVQRKLQLSKIKIGKER